MWKRGLRFISQAIEDTDFVDLNLGKQLQKINQAKPRDTRPLERTRIFPPTLVHEVDAIELATQTLSKSNNSLALSRVKPEDINIKVQQIPKEPVTISRKGDCGRMDIGIEVKSSVASFESVHVSTYLNMTPVAFNMIVQHMERHLNTVKEFVNEAPDPEFEYTNKHQENLGIYPRDPKITRDNLEQEVHTLFKKVQSTLTLQTAESYNLLLEMWLTLGNVDEFENVLDDMLTLTTRLQAPEVKFDPSSVGNYLTAPVKHMRREYYSRLKEQRKFKAAREREVREQIYEKFGMDVKVSDISNCMFELNKPHLPIAKVVNNAPVAPNDYTYYLLLKAFKDDPKRYDSIVLTMMDRLMSDSDLRKKVDLPLYNIILRRYLKRNNVKMFDTVLIQMKRLSIKFNEETLSLILHYHCLLEQREAAFKTISKMIEASVKHLNAVLDQKPVGRKLKWARKQLLALKSTLKGNTTELQVRAVSPLIAPKSQSTLLIGVGQTVTPSNLLESEEGDKMIGSGEISTFNKESISDEASVTTNADINEDMENIPRGLQSGESSKEKLIETTYSNLLPFSHMKKISIPNQTLYRIVHVLCLFPQLDYFSVFMNEHEISLEYSQYLQLLEGLKEYPESFKLLVNHLFNAKCEIDYRLYNLSFQTFHEDLDRIIKLNEDMQCLHNFSWQPSCISILEKIYAQHERFDLVESVIFDAIDTSDSIKLENLIIDKHLSSSIIHYATKQMYDELIRLCEKLLSRRLSISKFDNDFLRLKVNSIEGNEEVKERLQVLLAQFDRSSLDRSERFKVINQVLQDIDELEECDIEELEDNEQVDS